MEGFKMPGPKASRKSEEADGQGPQGSSTAEAEMPSSPDVETHTDSSNDSKLKPLADKIDPTNGSPNSEMLPPMRPAPISSKSKDGPPNLSSGDGKSREQRSAEKEAKYAEIISSLKYHPPETGASVADSRYSFEVLKTGTIVDRVKFKPSDGKGFYIIGRVPACDIVAENPTVSRTHAILQFIQSPKGTPESKSKDNTDEDGDEGGVPRQTGLYIYDLSSTHGTYINKNQVFANRYYRLRVGHVLKFGNSTRLYVLLGPSEDAEEESDKSVTELQNEKLHKELERKKLEQQGILIKTGGNEGEDEDGCTWGMAEDADEESDLRENPFAINFEESEGFDNPKRTLRGWFEREGDELVYDCREKAPGQFICRINLPIDGPGGQPVFAEVDVKGKKKEAVHQAALQACQILDKYGVLRQSHHEGKAKLKRKEKDWEDRDYYSSDEDTFLDRTGTVEKKREKRMKMAGKIEEQAETFESLSEKAAALKKEMDSLESQISKAQSMNNSEEEVDLDDYVKYLKTGASDVKKLKSKLRETNEELKRVTKLLNIVRPASLPPNLLAEKKPAIVSETKPSSSEISSTKPTATKSISLADTTQTESKPHEIIKSDSNVVKMEKESETSTVKSEVTEGTKSLTPPVAKPRKLFGPRMPAKPLSDLLKHQQTLQEKSEDKMDVDTESKLSGDKEADNPMEESEEESDDAADADVSKPSEALKPKKKRNRQRQQKFKKDVKYDYDASDPKYSTWVPPTDQQGDGRTSLNEKLGY